MAEAREDRVRFVLAEALRALAPTGRWLLVDVELDAETGPADVTQWYRRARGDRPATAAPPDGPFDGIVLRLVKGREALRMVLHLLAARLAPGGVMLVGGANDEGIRPARKRLDEVMSRTEVVSTRRHCRVIRGDEPRTEPDVVAGGDLEAWGSQVDAAVAGVELSWRSYPSLFAHGRLDPGTELLLSSLPPLSGPVLDFASGAGVVAQFLSRRGDPVQIEMSDIDPLALHAAAVNVPGAGIHLADGLPTSGGPWSAIVSNPPLHLGTASDVSVMRALAATAPHRLRPGGQLWLVVQGSVPVRGHLEAFRAVDRVAQTPSYAVWRASK